MKLLKHISHIKKVISWERQGFTLIELLVVIGILGILAAGLLAAIDPLEQLRKGRDSQKRSVAIELYNAMGRYVAVFGTMPWGNGALAAQSIVAGTFTPSIGSLTGTGELKTTFQTSLNAGMTSGAYALTVAGQANGGGFNVCFDPESKAISRDPNTLFTSMAAPPAEGTNPGNVDTGYYFCAR